MRHLIAILLFCFFVFAKECPDQFDSKGFLDAPFRVGEIVDGGLKSLKLFGSFKEYKKLGFELVKTVDGRYYLKKGCFIKVGDEIYPKCSGLWRYHLNKNGNVDEFDIAEVFEYQDRLEDVANEINSDFEGLWSDWRGDAYGYHLFPEDAQLRYGNVYIAFNVFIYGVKEDATTLKNTVVDYRFLNYTNEVKNYLKCKEEDEKKSTFKRK